MTIKPTGYFDELARRAKSRADSQLEQFRERLTETSDRVSFDRFRLLDIDWDELLPNSIYEDELDLKYTKTHFESVWGNTPFATRRISNSLLTVNINDYAPNSANQSDTMRTWEIGLATNREYTVVSHSDSLYWLVSRQPIDLVSSYDDAWGHIDRVVLIKQGQSPAQREINIDDLVDLNAQLEYLRQRIQQGWMHVQPALSRVVSTYQEIYTDFLAKLDKKVAEVDVIQPQTLRTLIENDWDLTPPPPSSDLESPRFYRRLFGLTQATIARA